MATGRMRGVRQVPQFTESSPVWILFAESQAGAQATGGHREDAMVVRSASRRRAQALSLAAALALALLVTLPGSARAAGANVAISQVYGGGGNTGAPLANDFVELLNRGTTSASVAGWSLQYTSATGTGNLGANASQLTELPDVSLAPGQYLLVQEASNAAVGDPLPAPDVIDGTPISMSATGGKVALVEGTTTLGCNGSSTPCPSTALERIVDLVGYDGANFFEGTGPAPATSEGLFVFNSSAPTVAVGDAVVVGGRVSEFRPGGADGATNLTTTEITGPSATALSSGNPLPAPTVVGTGGRVPPGEVIEDDATGDVETNGAFDPATDGIDFWESLEGMRVELDDAVATGPRNTFGEISVVGDGGANAAVRTARGGVVVRPGDFNPERVLLDDSLAPTPTVDVGDSFPGAVVGVLDYSFGNFKLEVTATPTVTRGGLTREVTAPTAANQLALATFNVENLDPGDPQTKFDQLAGLIVDNLRAPDLVAVEEIQDDNGPTDNGVVTADTTFAELIAAVQAAGGPTYDFRQIDPVNDQDGGEPGGNIRVGFLFRTDRGLQFIDRPGGTSTAATTVVGAGADTRLSFSPGRIDPANGAFNASRKPLAGEFTYNGHHLFVIANHFNSKGGDDPLFGHSQPPTLVSEAQRKAQATVVHDFVTSLETADPDAAVVVLGDLNDFEFSPPLATLEAGVLHDLIETLPQAERYTYDFEGNSQALDHILLSDSLFAEPFDYDAVHVNSEFATQASDHDPQVVRITLGPLFNFSGFLQPVDNLPVRNTMRAGLAVPVNFSLDGYKGLGIMASGYPKSQPIACDTSAPTDAVETTLPALLSVLLYDPRTDTYVYVWKTDRSWANTCRQLIVKLDDGSVHRANFQFTRR